MSPALLRLWPLPLDVLHYSALAFVLFVTSAILGLAGGLALGRRPWHRLLSLAVVGMLVVAVLVHLAAAVTLGRDPMRDLGSIPLPPPLAASTSWLGIALALLSPGFAAFVLTRVILSSPRRHPILLVASLVASIYAACVAPWALAVLLD